MRLTPGVAIAAALMHAVAVASANVGQTLLPGQIPTKVVHNQWIIKASVGGKDGWYVLATDSKISVRLPRAGESGPDGRRQTSDVTIGPDDGGDVNFQVSSSAPLKAMGVDGLLGCDALQNFTLAFDIESAQVLVWSQQPSLLAQRGWVILAPVIGNATQHAITLSVDDVDKMPYGVGCTVGSAKGLAVIQLSESQGIFTDAALAQASTLTTSTGAIAVDDVGIGEVGSFWAIGARAAVPLPYAAGGEVAALPLTSLPVRRVVFDGHTGTIVTETLGRTGVTSVLLSRLLGIPIEADGSALFVREGGALYGPALEPYSGAAIVAIGGISADDIVGAFQESSAMRLDMIKRLARVRTGDYALDFVLDGKPYRTTVKAGV